MRKILLATVAVGMLAFIQAPPAHAIGCLSGGIVGGIVGHQANHGIMGAVGGCVVGHEIHRMVEKYKADHDGRAPSLSQLRDMLPEWAKDKIPAGFDPSAQDTQTPGPTQ